MIRFKTPVRLSTPSCKARFEIGGLVIDRRISFVHVIKAGIVGAIRSFCAGLGSEVKIDSGDMALLEASSGFFAPSSLILGDASGMLRCLLQHALAAGDKR
jgi:hypothetical protein